MTIRKRTRGQTIIYKTLHRKVVCPLVFFLIVIVFSVLLRLTVSDTPFCVVFCRLLFVLVLNNLQNTTQKGVSETVNLRRTENTMTIRKKQEDKQ
jgi:hypothetical protein